MENSSNSIKLLINNVECFPQQINRYIKDISLSLYNEKIINFIDHLDSIAYNDEPIDCIICTEQINKGMLITNISCGHKIHHHCIIKLIISSADDVCCPLCRNKILNIADEDKIESQLFFKKFPPLLDVHTQLTQLLNSLNISDNNYQVLPFIINK